MASTSHPHLVSTSVWIVLLLVLIIGLVANGVLRRGWRRRWRTGMFMTGMLLLLVAFSPVFMSLSHHDFRWHMYQHLMIGMVAPLALVLSAPVSLILRSLPQHQARAVTGWFRSRGFGYLTHPLTALVLNMGGMYILYLTPLYSYSLHQPLLHLLIHLHTFLAGYLFCFVTLAGPDPLPDAAPFRIRFAVLFVSMGFHAMLAKIMYGWVLPGNTHHGVEEIQAGARIMYYGGDMAEILLAVALIVTWLRLPERHRPPLLSPKIVSLLSRVGQ